MAEPVIVSVTGFKSRGRLLCPPWWSAALFIALGFLLPASALAECRNATTPSYSDISSVMFERNGCGGFTHKPGDLRCSRYWVYFGRYFKTTYSQSEANIGRGGYVLGASLQQAREVLQQHDFFSLTPPDTTVTDIAYSILTVRRCNVIVRLLMYPAVAFQSAAPIGDDPEVASLFSDLDALVARSTKSKVSDRDLYFDLNVFDPDRFAPGECIELPFALNVAGCKLSPLPRP